MKSRIILNSLITFAALVVFYGCQTETPASNGLLDGSVDASFTITPVSGVSNKYVLNAQKPNILGSKWNLGDGSNTFVGKFTENIFLPDAGSYTITHTAIGKGGETKVATKEIVVPVSDPNSGNLILGGKFSNATDHGKWTILNISGTATKWTFNNGNANINGGSWSQQGIYQAIEVVAGKKYKIDMRVSGSGSQDTWFEVYASPTAPTQNADYTADGRRIGLSTWDGCAKTTFDGQLSALKCVGSGNVVEFPQSGTIYFVIKSGGANMGATGITITNVEFRGV
jgi:hypothetical protein